jgi:hypothetical protein
MASNEQLSSTNEDRVWGYPDGLLNNDGQRTPTLMPFTPGILVGAPVPVHRLFDTPMANDDRRRRSSSMSPRTIRASTYRTPYTPFFPPSNPQTLTPRGSINFTNHITQAQVVAEPNAQTLNRSSLSTITATTGTSTTSTYTETPMRSHGHDQRAIFALLSEICNEALRRKWHDEAQRQSIRSLASRRPHLLPHHPRCRGRYSPYDPLPAVPSHHSHISQMARSTGAISLSTEQPPRFTELMQRIATTMWESATHPQHQPQATQNLSNGPAPEPTPMPTSGESETAAIDSMRTLYSLGNSIMAATSAATIRAEYFNLDEVRDIIGIAAGFCRFLGYREGAERCEEMGRRPLGEEERQERGWESGVL